MRLLLRATGMAVFLAAALCLGAAAAPDAGEEEEPEDLDARIEALLSEIRAGRNDKITFGSISTLRAYSYDLERMRGHDDEYEARMSARIDDIMAAAGRGEDRLADERGFLWRGYRSRYSSRPQMYSIYVPESYEPSEPIPLVVTLHGGSSNHNVWLAINLGNKISVKDYWASFRKEFKAKRHPSAIVVSPDGLGQIRWRWSGEQDVLDVINDVKSNYNIDPDKVFLTGLSNGGIGAYTIGLKHASEFAGVLPLAGVTDWLGHHEADGRHRRVERNVLRNESALTYAENAANTHLRFYHGARDPGFSVEQARSMADKLTRLAVPFKYHEFPNQGHDLSYVLWRKLLVMRYVKQYTRQTAPESVRLVTASGRANKQAWVVLDDRFDHVSPARVRADVSEDRSAVEVETSNAARVTLLLNESPALSPVRIVVDGQEVYTGPCPPDGRITFSSALAPAFERDEDERAPQPVWSVWDGLLPPPGSCKQDGLSGPLGDANYERQVHVYGTLVEADRQTLRKAALLGARGWMLARDYTEIRHPVIPDKELTWEMMRESTVVLYGNATNNSVLAEIGDRLPIKVGKKHLEMRGKKISGWGVGARFVCPNPLAPSRYLVVAAGTSADAVEQGGRLPIYLGDYIVYNYLTTKRRAFMVLGGRKEIETGYFTERWRLPDEPPDR